MGTVGMYGRRHGTVGPSFGAEKTWHFMHLLPPARAQYAPYVDEQLPRVSVASRSTPGVGGKDFRSWSALTEIHRRVYDEKRGAG
jgi:hypothetical protein